MNRLAAKKHLEVIKAFAEGKEIQVKVEEYRIKSEPVVKYVLIDSFGRIYLLNEKITYQDGQWLKLTYDENGKVCQSDIL